MFELLVCSCLDESGTRFLSSCYESDDGDILFASQLVSLTLLQDNKLVNNW